MITEVMAVRYDSADGTGRFAEWQVTVQSLPLPAEPQRRGVFIVDPADLPSHVRAALVEWAAAPGDLHTGLALPDDEPGGGYCDRGICALDIHHDGPCKV